MEHQWLPCGLKICSLGLRIDLLWTIMLLSRPASWEDWGWYQWFWLLEGLPTHLSHLPASLVRYRCLPWFPRHSVPLPQRKKLPHAELQCVDFMMLEMGCVFLLKGKHRERRLYKMFPQTKESVGKWTHASVLVNPLDASHVGVWGELTACLVKVLHVTHEETEAEIVVLDTRGLRLERAS